MQSADGRRRNTDQPRASAAAIDPGLDRSKRRQQRYGAGIGCRVRTFFILHSTFCIPGAVRCCSGGALEALRWRSHEVTLSLCG